MKLLPVALLVLCAAALAAWLTNPAPLAPSTDVQELAEDPDSHLRRREAETAQVRSIVPGAEKHIRWAAKPGERTERVLVYLHGFSATRQEIAPVPERVAEALGANLFETRLSGHGLEGGRLENVLAEDWLDDGAEALAIGKMLGERLILMGTSTGATLALAMAPHPDFAQVESLVFLSPNFHPAAAGSSLMTGPFGPQIISLSTGATHQWEPANELQAKYWTTSYSSTSLIQMMRLVDLAVELTPEARVDSALFIYSPADEVVSVEALLAGFAALPAKRKELEAVETVNGLSNHVLSGDILAPASTASTVARIVHFLEPVAK